MGRALAAGCRTASWGVYGVALFKEPSLSASHVLCLKHIAGGAPNCLALRVYTDQAREERTRFLARETASTRIRAQTVLVEL